MKKNSLPFVCFVYRSPKIANAVVAKIVFPRIKLHEFVWKNYKSNPGKRGLPAKAWLALIRDALTWLLEEELGKEEAWLMLASSRDAS